MLWTRSSFNCEWVKRSQYWTGGWHLLRHLQVLAALFLEHFPPDHIGKLKCDCFYGGLPKRLKAMVAYLKAIANEKMYSDYLCAAWKSEKEEAMESSCSQTVATATTSKPVARSFFPLWNLKGSQPTRTPAVWVAHLEWRRRTLTKRSALTVRTQMASKA